ncbi:MAG: DNA integrity scanning protein DisA nucleotide-binding domain protein [Verrucomicrobia bacterium]|nr:DNA integrity scanning protein DisA nucleotide-binding domain protein [Verrucomicrobiota bacterium]
MNNQTHTYPDLLAQHIWQHGLERVREQFGFDDIYSLSAVLSVCYQASLLKQEGQSVICRVCVCPISDLDPSSLYSYSFYLSLLQKPRRFDEQEIRRLSPAASFSRSLIAITGLLGGGFEIAGLVQTGQWSRDLVADLQGMMHSIPDWLIIHVRGPGNLVVYQGARRLATLLNGRVEGHGFNVFASSWMAEHCLKGRKDLPCFKDFAKNADVEFNEDLQENFDTNFFKRVISDVRDKRHGGTLVFGSESLLNGLLSGAGPLQAKYRIGQNKSSTPYCSLVDRVTRRLVSLAKARHSKSVGWLEFVSWSDELSYSISTHYLDLTAWLSDLATIDGCLLMDHRFRVIAYGVEIQIPGHEAEVVYRALDLEGERKVAQSAEHFGTRHRSAYRLCREITGCLAVVISQDGTVQFVTNHRGQVTYWSHLSF